LGLSLLALSGCSVMQAKPQPFGRDTYMVNAITPEGNVRIANGFCSDKHQIMQPEHISGNSFVFTCVPPASASPTRWRTDGGVVTFEEEKK
jgi:hypothetical protein